MPRPPRWTLLAIVLLLSLLACGLPSAVKDEPSPLLSTPTATATVATQVPTKTDTPEPTGTREPEPRSTEAPIPASPTPTEIWMMDLEDWPAMTRQEWPRPAQDNGLCIHFIPEQYHTAEDLDHHIGRIVSMRMKWALVIYADEIQLEMAARKFRDTGITVVWRKMLYPGDRYFNWGRDVQLLQSLGMPPYIQIYNEPSVEVLWDDPPVSKLRFTKDLLRAARDVYNAGGYVGLQFVDPQLLRDALFEIRLHGGEPIFGRMFFVPHPYGLNHPPSYQEDLNAVLGFLHFANVFQEEIGFVPPMIAGEGGWKYAATDDDRFPRVDDQLHRDYHLELFNWFRTGTLSNGEPLPDYLFAFCPWLLASKMDDSAWFDSFAGDHVLTIEAVRNMPSFNRRFTWD
ncbi:MAG: hypothetical protein WBB22_14850 [Anaerolineae bacterium]